MKAGTKKQATSPPVVLLISGNDPSGGAGVCADIQAVSALGCHPAPVITSLTIQDTCNAHEVRALDAAFVARQIDVIVKDIPVAAVKIGLLANAGIAIAVAEALDDMDDVPVVLDPVLIAAGGANLAEAGLAEAISKTLFAKATVITPNPRELAALSGTQEPDAGARRLIELGARHVLSTGADLDTAEVSNRLYGAEGLIATHDWPRLPGEYHGSGCTLASAIAALLARGTSLTEASAGAQAMVWDWLAAGFQPGRGQRLPLRHEPNRDA